jgi:O-methyltransferase
MKKLQQIIWRTLKALLPVGWSTYVYRIWNIGFGDVEVKKRFLVQKYDRKLSKHNILLYRPHLFWLNNPEFIAVQENWKQKGVPVDRRFFIWQIGTLCQSLPGATADCGIAYGTSTYFFLSGLGPRDEAHYIFDSFEGLSVPGKDDGTSWAAGDICVDENLVKQNLKAFDKCVYYKGWIPSRFAELPDERFAFVHIDVDLYQPTIDCLQYFYPRLCDGGVILGDDYGFMSCPGARKAFDEFFADKPEMLVEIPNGQVMVIKR